MCARWMSRRLLIIAAAVFFTAAPANAAPLRTVATTADLAALVSVVGGDLVAVDTIIPPAADPEAFEPRPGDLERVRRAELLVRVGLGYDHWLDQLIVQSGNAEVARGSAGYVDASTGIPLLEVRGRAVTNEGGHSHGAANPHYWLDPQNAVIVTAAIAEALIRVHPESQERVIAQRDRFVRALDGRMLAWTEKAKAFAGAKLIAYHNSWPYFSRRFRLDIIDYIEPKPGVAPSPSHLARLIARGRAEHVRAILHEPYEPEDASRFLAQKLGVPMIVPATSVGSQPAATDYLELIEHDVSTLAAALGQPAR
jgi:ABC-type Zn uptake system ZnuABC Zn-binding protein ZnuA